MQTINESDWKIFKQLHDITLERFCERALSEVTQLASETQKNSHERYLAIYKVIQERDKELADAFDGPRRSMALLQLASIVTLGLLTDEEMARFSVKTREAISGVVHRMK